MVINYFSFVIGGICTSYILYPISEFEFHSRYRYIFILLIMASMVTQLLYVGFPNPVYYIWTASLTNGIQNAMSSLYSHGQYRTTHITGLTTDLSIYFGQKIHQDDSHQPKLNLWLSSLMGLLIGSFLGIASLHVLGIYCFIPTVIGYTLFLFFLKH